MNFCTLFDSYYLHKGIATYLSLETVTDDFHLYVVAFDKDCYDRLKSFGFQHMTVDLVDDFETPELLAVKPTRTRAEYCWTCGSSIVYYFIKKYNLDSLTYIDADMMFVSNPKILLDEIGDCSIGLSPHFEIPENKNAGHFCVQFVYFKNDDDGMAALTWWKDRCIEWCFSRYEDGKFGDQKYLDYIPEKFNKVHIFKNRGCGVAPWNMHQYKYGEGLSFSYQGVDYQTVFYHMHGTIFSYENEVLSLTMKFDDATKIEKEKFFYPYLNLVKEVYEKYLNKKVNKVVYIDRNFVSRCVSFFKHMLRDNRLAIWIYRKLAKGRFDGYEKTKN